MTKTYKIEVDCAVCAGEMERRVNKVFGVENAVVNFIMQKMTVNFSEGADIEEVQKEMLKAVKKFSRDCNIEF